MATPNEYLEKAASYIGIGGTDNIFNTWIWGQHVYNPNQYPWCAAFQSYVGIHDLGMPFNASASAAGVGWQGEPIDDADVQPGDWVLFNWDGRQDFGWADHIGVVEWSDINGSGLFGTIEGNTGPTYEGEVMRQTRNNNAGYATKFFRPPYSGSSSKPTWVQDDKGWWYKHADGSYTSNDWEEIDGLWYFFNEDGYMATGWLKWKKNWYYLQPQTETTGTKFGYMVIGWHPIEDKWYLFADNGIMLTGWQEVGGDWYYLQPHTKETGTKFGYMLTGWQTIKWNDKPCKFYFSEKMPVGVMIKNGFYKIKNKWYAFDKNGVVITLDDQLKLNPETGEIKIITVETAKE